MAASIILTMIGTDRPGLVRALSETVAAFDGNWLESRMARLVGQFAGIVSVRVPESKAEALIRALRELEVQGIRLTVEQGIGEEAPSAYKGLTLELIGHDHPGIVRDIARALAERGVNIEELDTEIVRGSWSGANLFRATIRLRTHYDLNTDDLREVLERLACDLMVEITLDDSAKPAAAMS